MIEDKIRAVMALADAYAMTGYSAVSLTLAKAMPQRAALDAALRALPVEPERFAWVEPEDSARGYTMCRTCMQPFPAPALAPLTATQAFALITAWHTMRETGAMELVRMVERAHGIGAEVSS